jgi:hypothetical protein
LALGHDQPSAIGSRFADRQRIKIRVLMFIMQAAPVAGLARGPADRLWAVQIA